MSKAPSTAADLFPQLLALMLLQHLLVNYLLKVGIVLPVKSYLNESDVHGLEKW